MASRPGNVFVDEKRLAFFHEVLPTINSHPDLSPTVKGDATRMVNDIIASCTRSGTGSAAIPHIPTSLRECLSRHQPPSLRAFSRTHNPSTSSAPERTSHVPTPTEARSTDLAKAMAKQFEGQEGHIPKISFRHLPAIRNQLYAEFEAHTVDPTTAPDEQKNMVEEWNMSLFEGHKQVTSAYLEYEVDQCLAYRMIIAEPLNRIMADARAMSVDPGPSAARPHWVTPKQEKLSGVTDMICYSRNVVRALLEYKRPTVLSDDDMSGMVSASAAGVPPALGQPSRGYQLWVEHGRVRVSDDRVMMSAARTSLQLWVEMHHYKSRWVILFNSSSTVVAYLADTREIFLSPIIRRDAGARDPDLTLAVAMYITAFTDWRPEPAAEDVAFLDLAKDYQALLSDPEGGGGDGGTATGRREDEDMGGDASEGHGGNRNDDMLVEEESETMLPGAKDNLHLPSSLDLHSLLDAPAKSASVSHLRLIRPVRHGIGRIWRTFGGIMQQTLSASHPTTVRLASGIENATIHSRPPLWSSNRPRTPTRPSSTPSPSSSPSTTIRSSPSNAVPTDSPPTSAEVDGAFVTSQSVIIKVCFPNSTECSSPPAEIRQSILREARLYQKELFPLGDTCVPVFHGLFSSQLHEVNETWIMVLEDVGRSIVPLRGKWEDVHDLDKQPIIDLYTCLHAAGVLHRDISPRHIRFRPTDNQYSVEYRLIDFDQACIVDEFDGNKVDFDAALKEEMWRVCGHLGCPRPMS